jgi:hypothetical protein
VSLWINNDEGLYKLAKFAIQWEGSKERAAEYMLMTLGDNAGEKVMYLGFSEGGLSVSMWGEINPCDLVNLSFLGKEISFSDLSPESQNHVIDRIQ